VLCPSAQKGSHPYLKRSISKEAVNFGLTSTFVLCLFFETFMFQFDEYCQVMEGVGLGVNELGVQSLKTLYRIADRDGNGNIDFNEFLVAVVGNFVSI